MTPAANAGLARTAQAPDPRENALVETGKEIFPSILTSTIIQHQGKKYLCGTAHRPGESIVIRYVMSLEADWQIWEPDFESDGWNGYNTTHYEICGDTD
jgi:hypothetical protein